MSLKVLLFTYVFGGLTFLPLLAATILAIAWYTLPLTHDTQGQEEDEQNRTLIAAAAKKLSDAAHAPNDVGDGAASATFAVLRRYDFQAALAAFKDAATATNTTDGVADASTGGESISVYQSMYRSVFDRNRNQVNPLHEGEEEAQQRTNNKARGRGKVFYIILRHGHLMLYDSSVQLEVRHVISLAHYDISIQDDDVTSSAHITEPDLFVKRTAIVLTHRSDESTRTGASQRSQSPFYLFCATNIDKEDFYHALLSSIPDPPIPMPFDAECAIKLQSALHSNSLTPETRAFNALIGRVFLAMRRTPFLADFVRSKIEKKISRTQKPAFIASVACHSLDLGNAAPIISNVRLKDMHISGDTLLALDLKYSGHMNLTISAMAKLDLGQRFKTRMVSLVLAVVLQRIQGKVLVRVKPPPSNRIWFCFESMPDMDLKVEPVVSSRQITYAFILRAIEARIREAFADGLVKPNWDDVPFFHTDAQFWRGGIWESEGAAKEDNDTTAEPILAKDGLGARNGKSMSMPALVPSAAEALETSQIATSSGIHTSERDVSEAANLKRRSATNLPSHYAQVAADRATEHSASDRAATYSASPARVPRPMRSPSIASPTPVVAVDDFSADAVRSDDATATPARRRWIGRGAPQIRDAAEAVRQVRDRDTVGREKESRDDNPEFPHDGDGDDTFLSAAVDESSDNGSLRRTSESGFGSETQTPERRLSTHSSSTASLPRLNGGRRQNTEDSGHHRTDSRDSTTSQQQRKTILASTAAATAAARQWTWNAVANRQNRQQLWNRNAASRQASLEGETVDKSVPQQQKQQKQSAPTVPMGRGRPLPPPGMPLPGPQPKGIFGAAAAGLGSIRRRPVPLAKQPHQQRSLSESKQDDDRRSANSNTESLEDERRGNTQLESHGIEDMTDDGIVEGDGEFGPWMANHNEFVESHDEGDNPGPALLERNDIKGGDEAETLKPVQKTKKVPPPLPPRRRAERSSSPESSALHSSLAEARDSPSISDINLKQTRHNEAGSNNHVDSVSLSALDSVTKHGAEVPKRPDTTKNAVLGRTAADNLIDLEDDEEHAVAAEEKLVQDLEDESSAAEPEDEFDDEIVAIPAPVSAEAEKTGQLDIDDDGAAHGEAESDHIVTHKDEGREGTANKHGHIGQDKLLDRTE